MKTHFLIATGASCKRLAVLFCWISLGACSALPQPPEPLTLYDLGPGESVRASASAPGAQRPALALDEVQAQGLLDTSAALTYRLVYRDAQQLRPYRQARWAQPPAQLLQHRVAEVLGQERAILQVKDNPQSTSPQQPRPRVLRLELQEFAQHFSSAQDSHALLRLRATVAAPVAAGEVLVAQQVFSMQQPAPSADAAGGAQALAHATQQLALALAAWLRTLE